MSADSPHRGDGDDIDADICIVGAGPAGLALAREFVGTAVRVVVLESGGHRLDPVAESLNHPPADYDGDYPVAASRARYFGGGANLWAGVCLPFETLAFEPCTWLPHSGWPLGRDDLDPFYARACAALHIGPPGLSDVSALRHAGGRTPRLVESDDVATTIMQFCGVRRPIDWGHEIAASGNITTVLNATAVAFETNRDGTAVDRLRVLRLDRTGFAVSAKVYVVATGAIENARLLLASGGIGNRHDQVGRYFADHYNLAPGFVEVKDREMNLDLYTQPRRRGEGWTCGALVLRATTQRAHQLAGIKARFYTFSEDDYSDAVRAMRELLAAARGRQAAAVVSASARMLRGPLHLARFLTWRALRRHGIDIAGRRMAIAEVAMELEANPENRVTLSGERDALGQPRAAVHLCPSEADRRRARAGLQLIEGALETCGVSRMLPVVGVEPLLQARFAHHQVGTTRMDDRPTHGVVGPDCRVHVVDNLYVGGSSVFPTVGTANPTLTIIALAIRLADHLKGRL